MPYYIIKPLKDTFVCACVCVCCVCEVIQKINKCIRYFRGEEIANLSVKWTGHNFPTNLDNTSLWRDFLTADNDNKIYNAHYLRQSY